MERGAGAADLRLIGTGAVKHLGDPGIAAVAARMWEGSVGDGKIRVEITQFI